MVCFTVHTKSQNSLIILHLCCDLQVQAKKHGECGTCSTAAGRTTAAPKMSVFNWETFMLRLLLVSSRTFSYPPPVSPIHIFSSIFFLNREKHQMCFWTGSEWENKELPKPIKDDVYFETRKPMQVFVK